MKLKHYSTLLTDDIDSEFKNEVKCFVEELLSSKSLLANVKRINDQNLNGEDFFDLFKLNFEKFSENNFNFALSWFECSAENYFAREQKKAYDFYRDSINDVKSISTI